MDASRLAAPSPHHFALSGADRERIAAAVTAAEAHTAGEIVTILADRSDEYADIALLWAASMALLALAMLSLAPRFWLGLIDRVAGDWASGNGGGGGQWLPGSLFALAAVAAVAAYAATWLLLRAPALRLALVPGALKHARVRARAVGYYRVGTDARTSGGTGVLIYLSRREHRAEIVTDANVTAAIPIEEWGAAMAAMVGHLAADRVADGMVEAIGMVGTVLARHFPRDSHDVNELPDRVIEV